MSAIISTVEVAIDLVLPARRIGAGEDRVLRKACIVDENVDDAQIVSDCLKSRLDCLSVSHIDTVRDNRSAGGRKLGSEFSHFITLVQRCYCCAVARKISTESLAYASGCTGYRDDLAGRHQDC